MAHRRLQNVAPDNKRLMITEHLKPERNLKTGGVAMVTKRSRCAFPNTVETLESAIKGAGNTVFATIDQSAAAASAGTTLRPTTLILFGNPMAGTPVMDAFPLVALELPFKLLVWEENGTVTVAYVTMSEIAAKCGVTGMEPRIAAMDDAIATLVGTVAE